MKDYSFLEEFYAREKIKVVALNPRKVPRLREVLWQRAKSDKIDAELLYEYHKLVAKEEIKLLKLNEKLEKLSILFSEFKLLQKIESKFRNFLEYLDWSSVDIKESRAYIAKQLETIKARISKIKKEMNRLVKEDKEINEGVEEISQVKVIRFLTATYCYLFIRKWKIRNSREVVA